HITPANYYSPVPRSDSFPRSTWPKPSQLVGIDLREDDQLAFLERMAADLSAEYAAFPTPPEVLGPPEFWANPEWLPLVAAAALNAMIRFGKPSRILEVGSGYSTLLTSE